MVKFVAAVFLVSILVVNVVNSQTTESLLNFPPMAPTTRGRPPVAPPIGSTETPSDNEKNLMEMLMDLLNLNQRPTGEPMLKRPSNPLPTGDAPTGPPRAKRQLFNTDPTDRPSMGLTGQPPVA
uniref:Uncharacterized protein n=1 Tax=Panagrolaimus sp. ES5 TaxID=591445 RepID=A0AC34FUB3_9BILA